MPNEKKYNIWWDDKVKIARAKAYEILDEEAARGILKATNKIAEEHGDSIDWLIDLTEMTKATSRARKILAEATGHASIRKYAFFGASVLIRTVARFISAAAGQKNAKHFATEQQALKWIMEDRPNGKS